MERHTYKVCQVLPRDPDQKMGRPRRNVLMSWEDLSDEDVEALRKLQEPRLKVGQIAELDGKIVARSPEIEASDVAEDDADDAGDASPPNIGDPVAVTEHATRMLWDVYRKHAEASAELREQTNEMNRRAIAQAKQLDEVLGARQQSPPINFNLEDLSNVFRFGASMYRDMKNAGDGEPSK